MRAEIFLQGLISFLIVAFGQPTFSPWIGAVAAALGYALFWRAIRLYPFAKQRFWRSALWYGCLTLIQLSWMTAIEYQGFYILFVWLGISIGVALQFGLLSILIPYNRPLSFPRILAISSLWTLFEWIRFSFLCGYSWNLSGLALSNTYAIQMASVFGILGLSFWVIFVNLLGLRAALKKGIPQYIVWACAACVPYLFGATYMGYHTTQMKEGNESIACACVQTGLLPSEKVPLAGKFQAFISPYKQWKRILVFLKEHREKGVDLIVLPEAALPLSSENEFYDYQKVRDTFFQVFGPISDPLFPLIEKGGKQKVSNLFWAQGLADLFKSEVVLGLDHVDNEGRAYNSAFHLKPFGNELSRYDKRVLMPLAEYLPHTWLTPLVASYGITDFFTPGKEAKIFEGKVPMGISICYEETFPEKVREGRLLGAKLLVNVTNDAWYPFSRLPSQHFELARFRAVENGAPLIRACNTGVTAVMDSFGRTIGKIEEQNSEGTLLSGSLFARVVPYNHPTLFLFWGNWGILTLSTFFLLFFLILKKQMHF